MEPIIYGNQAGTTIKTPNGSTYWTSSQNWMVLSSQDLTAMMVVLALGLMRWGLQWLEGQMSSEEVRYY